MTKQKLYNRKISKEIAREKIKTDDKKKKIKY